MARLVAILFSSIILIIVVELIRREKLKFRYAFSWLTVSLAALFFAIYDKALFKVAKFFGFELSSNFIFFLLLSILVCLSLLMTLFLCEQRSRNDKMAQNIAILDYEIRSLKDKINE